MKTGKPYIVQLAKIFSNISEALRWKINISRFYPFWQRANRQVCPRLNTVMMD